MELRLANSKTPWPAVFPLCLLNIVYPGIASSARKSLIFIHDVAEIFKSFILR